MSKQPPSDKPTREDALRNEALVRNAMVDFISKHHRPPTVQELADATGLSDKTVKGHRKRVRLGDSSPNVFQQLTPGVLMKLYERATGYSHPAEKLLVVSGGKGCPSAVERHDYTEHYAPDPTAARLWVQLVEGWSEKTQHEHSGEVKTPGPPAIITITRHQSGHDNAQQPAG